MNQMLLLVSVLIALFLMSTKEGKKVAKDVSKSVSSVAGQKGKGGFPSGIVLLLVLVALLCLSRKGLVEGQSNEEGDGTSNPDQAAEAAEAAAAEAAAAEAAQQPDKGQGTNIKDIKRCQDLRTSMINFMGIDINKLI